MVYPKTIIFTCRVCGTEMSPSSIRKHLPRCINDTTVFDCEGRVKDIASVVIYTIAEYFGYKGVISYLNSPIGDINPSILSGGFFPAFLGRAHATIVSSYVQALKSDDKETYNKAHGNVFSAISHLAYLLYQNGKNFHIKYDIGYEELNRFSLLTHLYKDAKCKVIMNDMFSQLSDDSRYKFGNLLELKEVRSKYYEIKEFTEELKKTVPHLFVKIRTLTKKKSHLPYTPRTPRTIEKEIHIDYMYKPSLNEPTSSKTLAFIRLRNKYNLVSGVENKEHNYVFNTHGQLFYFDLCGRKLSKIPTDVFRLRSLEILKLGRNNLKSVPKAIKKLEALRSLFFRKNQFYSIPNAILQLDKLKFLSFSDNYLSYIPSEIKNMKSLEKLELDNNLLTRLPASLLEMSALRVVDVRGNKNFKENDKVVSLLRRKGVVVTTNESFKKLKIFTIYFRDKGTNLLKKLFEKGQYSFEDFSNWFKVSKVPREQRSVNVERMIQKLIEADIIKYEKEKEIYRLTHDAGIKAVELVNSGKIRYGNIHDIEKNLFSPQSLYNFTSILDQSPFYIDLQSLIGENLRQVDFWKNIGNQYGEILSYVRAEGYYEKVVQSKAKIRPYYSLLRTKVDIKSNMESKAYLTTFKEHFALKNHFKKCFNQQCPTCGKNVYNLIHAYIEKIKAELRDLSEYSVLMDYVKNFPYKKNVKHEHEEVDFFHAKINGLIQYDEEEFGKSNKDTILTNLNANLRAKIITIVFLNKLRLEKAQKYSKDRQLYFSEFENLIKEYKKSVRMFYQILEPNFLL